MDVRYRLELTEPAQPRPGALGRRYRLLLASSGISNLGDGVDAVALPLLATLITNDPVAFAGVAVAQRLPWLLVSLQAGALADRVDRRRLMVAMQWVRAGAYGAIALAAFGGWASMPLLYVVGLVTGVAETVYDNAAQAWLPRIVVRDQLERANGRLFAVEWSANQFAGPSLGGVLFAVASWVPMALDAVSFVVSGVLLGFARPRDPSDDVAVTVGSEEDAGAPRQAAALADLDPTPQTPDPPPRTSRMRDEILEGLRWLWRHRLLRTLAIVLGVLNGTAMMGMSIFALYAVGDGSLLGLSDVGFGLLFTVGGVGSLGAGLAAGRVAERLGRGVTLWISLLGFTVTTAAFGLFPNVVVVAVAMTLTGVLATLWNVVTVSLRQTVIPDELLGRVNSVYRFLGWGSMPVGALLGGVVASAFGLRAPWLVGAGLIVLVLPLAARNLSTAAVEEARTATG